MANRSCFLGCYLCIVLFLLRVPCTKGAQNINIMPGGLLLDQNGNLVSSVTMAIGGFINLQNMDQLKYQVESSNVPAYTSPNAPWYFSFALSNGMAQLLPISNEKFTPGKTYGVSVGFVYFEIVVSGTPMTISIPNTIYGGECTKVTFNNLAAPQTLYSFPDQDCQFFGDDALCDPTSLDTVFNTPGVSKDYYIKCPLQSAPYETFIEFYQQSALTGLAYVFTTIQSIPPPSFSTVAKFQIGTCSSAITVSGLDMPSDTISFSSNPACIFYSDSSCQSVLTSPTHPSPMPTSSPIVTLYVSCPTSSTSATLSATGNKGTGTSDPFIIYEPLSATGTQVDVNCHGGNTGSATAHPTGGPEPYTYEWTPSTAASTSSATATGLTAGPYSVIVHSGAQSKQVDFILVEPAAIQITEAIATHTNVKCYGDHTGAGAVTVTGGKVANTYKYSWSPNSADDTASVQNLGAGTFTVTVYDDNTCHNDFPITITQPQAALSASITNPTHVKCKGGSDGSATVVVSGGTIGSGYTYSWAPSGGTEATATGLSAQQYTVTVTDSVGCHTTATVTINEPADILLTSGGQQDVKCHDGKGGSATVQASGGTPASGNVYTYSWDVSTSNTATATGLSAGPAVVTVKDANNCPKTYTFTILQPDALTITPTPTDVVCRGASTGGASVTVAGGTKGSGYSFDWSGTSHTDTPTSSSISGQKADTYKVTVSDANSCTASKSINITEPDLFNVTPNFTGIKCFGGTTKLNANPVGGTAPFKYSWSPAGGTDSQSTEVPKGIYQLSASDNCQATYGTSVIVPEPTPIVLVPAQINVACNGDDSGSATVYASGGAPGYTYLWAPYGGTAETATGLRAGTFNVTVTDANGCQEIQKYIISEPGMCGIFKIEI
eukprot:Phypoly_transcript_01985.p1 GENE.Phypoly_transcript_01985~~Phypoly_transcript_01985.p1  ORF type:complete len:892 (+),score=113.62 Phypoly_transcript_01985:296-2971(+)